MPEVIRGDQSWAFFSCFSCYSIFVSLMHDYLCSVGLGPRFIVYFVVISAGFWFLFSQYWPWDCLGRASPKWPNVLLNSTETWKFHGSAWNFVAWGKLWVLVINQTSSTTCYWLQNHKSITTSWSVPNWLLGYRGSWMWKMCREFVYCSSAPAKSWILDMGLLHIITAHVHLTTMLMYVIVCV